MWLKKCGVPHVSPHLRDMGTGDSDLGHPPFFRFSEISEVMTAFYAVRQVVGRLDSGKLEIEEGAACCPRFPSQAALSFSASAIPFLLTSVLDSRAVACALALAPTAPITLMHS